MGVDLTERMKEAVMSKDIPAARSAILTEVRNDRTREEPRALALADLMSKELPGFYEPDNGFCSAPGNTDISDKLWTECRAAMMLNFSRERLCFIETIVRELNSKSISKPNKQSPVGSRKSKSKKTRSSKRILWWGLFFVSIVASSSLVFIFRNLQKQKTLRFADITKSRAEACPQKWPDECLRPKNRSAQVSTNTPNKGYTERITK